MTPKPINLSKEEILDKYNRSNIEAILGSFDLTVREKVYNESPKGVKVQITKVRTETYHDRSNGAIVLTRHFITKCQDWQTSTVLTVSHIVENGIPYQVFRNS